MKIKTYRMIATFLGIIAVLIVTPASWLFIHQDETPEELLA